MANQDVLTSLVRLFVRKGRNVPFSMPGAVNDTSRILAVDVGDLTDLLFHVPLLAAVRQRYPGSRIDFLLPEDHAPLVVPSGLARQCLVYTPKQLKAWRPAYGSLLRSLGKTGYDVAFVMTFDRHPALELAALASGASLRVGPGNGDAYPTINCELVGSASGQLYRGDRLSGLAPFFGLADSDVSSGWPLPEDRLRQMAQRVHFHKPNRNEILVGVDPGLGKCGQGLAVRKLQDLVRRVASRIPCRVLPLSTPENSQRVAEMTGGLDNLFQGIERDTLLETILLLAQTDLFLAGNTDLFHVAVALGVPAVGLFTENDSPQWEPKRRTYAKILKVAKGKEFDIEDLHVAVAAVVGDRTPSPVTIVTDEAREAQEEGEATEATEMSRNEVPSEPEHA